MAFYIDFICSACNFLVAEANFSNHSISSTSLSILFFTSNVFDGECRNHDNSDECDHFEVFRLKVFFF